MEQESKSPFFRAVADALDAAKQLRTTDDSILMVMADGVTASHLCGGNSDHLQAVLLNFMQRNPKVAEIVLRASIDYQVAALSAPVLRIPKVPADGIAIPTDGTAPWPVDLSKSRYHVGVDVASTQKKDEA